MANYKLRYSILSVLIIITLQSISQDKIKVIQKEKAIGINLVTDQEIKAIEYVFPNAIYQSFIDSVSDPFIIQINKKAENGGYANGGFKNSGKLLAFDTTTKEVKWSRNLLISAGKIYRYRNLLIQNFQSKSHRIDTESGKELWKSTNYILFINSNYMIGIGYKRSANPKKSKLQGTNLSDGSLLWSRTISLEFSWNDYIYLNDSIILFVSGGLHTVNLKTGKGWDYYTKTGKTNYGKMVGSSVLSSLGYGYSSGSNIVTDVVSNVIVDSTGIYFASREKFSRFDQSSGNIIWTVDIPKEIASKSKIFTIDSLIFIVNTGLASYNFRTLNFGTPYIAAYNKITGQRKYLFLLNDKNDPILGIQIHQEDYWFLFKNRIVKYSLFDGKLVLNQPINNEKYGTLKSFGEDHIYLRINDSIYSNLKGKTQYLFTDKNKILSLNNNIEITDEFNNEDVYIKYLTLSDYIFIARNNKTIILDSDDMKISEIGVSKNAKIIDKALYDTRGNSLLRISLSDLPIN
jgi:outer membrane protein assembly factor BamB